MSNATQNNPPVYDDKKQAQCDANRDPLSGRAGAHPVGTAIGAGAGGITVGVVAGAAIGVAAGPLGILAGAASGAVAGAVVGGLAGKAIAEEVNPTIEHGYWRQTFASRPYATAGSPYENYADAYRYGWESQARHQGKSFDQVESTLKQDWEKAKGESKLAWEIAKQAVRDSWERIAKSHSSH